MTLKFAKIIRSQVGSGQESFANLGTNAALLWENFTKVAIFAIFANISSMQTFAVLQYLLLQ